MRTRRFPFKMLVLCTLVLAGCEEEKQVAGAKPRPPAAKKEDTFIVGQRTQEVRELSKELKKGANVATQKITAKDPITLQGNAYVTSIGRIAIGNITHTMDLYQADHDGHYPATHDEFMEEIIKKGQISLPRLPHYQKYSYDPKEHKLVILEYPDLKDKPPQ
jgi:hypothetical protein